MSKKEKGHSKVPVILLFILALLLITVYIFGYLGYNIPVVSFAKSNQFKKALNEYNYQAAATVLNDSVSKDAALLYLDEHLNGYFDLCFSDDYDENSWSSYRGIEVFNDYTRDKVLAKMDETVSRFYQDEFSTEDAKRFLSRIGKFSFASEKLTDCIEMINEKESSVESYVQGIALANEGKYEDAVKMLKKVVKNDSVHYQAAQEAINSCKNLYGAPKLTEAQNYIDTHQTESAKDILNSLIMLFGEYPEAQAMLDGLSE